MNIQFFNLSLIAILFTSQIYAGEETIIDLTEVPDTIMATAQQLMPEVKFISADKEEETDGTLVFEIQGLMKDGRKVEVDILSNGDVEEIEVEFSQDLVPGAVMKAINAKLPGFIPSYIEASHSASKKVIQYEFEGVFGGEQIDLEVSADGRNIVISDK
jgi:hypothetical protein